MDGLKLSGVRQVSHAPTNPKLRRDPKGSVRRFSRTSLVKASFVSRRERWETLVPWYDGTVGTTCGKDAGVRKDSQRIHLTQHSSSYAQEEDTRREITEVLARATFFPIRSSKQQ